MVMEHEENEIGSENSNNLNDNPYAWKELMGKDITYRLLSSKSKNDSSQSPEARDLVRISFRGYTHNSNNNTNQLFIEKDDYVIVLGESDVPPGLEMGIRFCPVGCSAELKCNSKFAYGNTGRRKQKDSNDKKYVAVSPSCELYYSFFVHEIIGYMDDLEQVQLKKLIGNESFQYDLDLGYKALLVWKKALSMIESSISTPSTSSEMIESFSKITIDLNNNIALAYFHQKKYNEAKAACNVILDDLDEENIKAWIRLGYVLLELDADYPEINQVIQKAAKLSPGGMENLDVRKLYSIYKKKKMEYTMKRKEVSKKMMKPFHNLSDETNQDNNKDQGKTEDSNTHDPNEKVATGLGFFRRFGTIEMLMLTMIALVINELYYNHVLLIDLKQRLFRFSS